MWLAPRRTTRGGQPRYSDLAIEIALTLGLVFGLRLRQVEGLLGSVLPLMGLALAVPDHTTLSRRARNMAIAQQGACPPGSTGRASAYSCRQHWTAGLRRGPMVGGEAWRQMAPWLAKAACSTGCR
ncbi:transposase [Sinorhizobium medicae]